MADNSNVSSDLIWEVCRTLTPTMCNPFGTIVDPDTLGPNTAYLVKRRSGGGSQFSKDPLNLMNKHSRKVIAFDV